MKNRILAITGLVSLLTGLALRAISNTSNWWYSVPKNTEHIILYPAALISHPSKVATNFFVIIFILILGILFIIAFIVRNPDKQSNNL